MNILATQYTLQTHSLEIYVAGCSGNPHCDGCHNPESWDFTCGTPIDNEFWKGVDVKIKDFGGLISNIMIFGGEPLDQPEDELINMLKALCDFERKIWLFTRYELDDVPERVKEYCDYIKCGRYLPELKTENNVQYGIKLATYNQCIFKKGKDY